MSEEKETDLGFAVKPQFKVSSNKGYTQTFPDEAKAYDAYNREQAKYLKKQIPFRLSLKSRENSQQEWNEIEQTVRNSKFYEED